MKLTKTLNVLILFVALSVTSMTAQKYGYLNSAQLLTELNEIKAADSEIAAYQKQLVSKGEAMVKTFETKYQKYAQEAQSGEFSPVQVQEKEADLAAEQQKIQQYEVEVQGQIAKKREELYQPILDKVKNIVDALGKEKGYTMIFDTSTGALLFADEGEDLMAEVKSRLGM
jgi:outer membrane protein